MVLASTPQDTQKYLWGIVNLKHKIELFHFHLIPMTLYKDIICPILINLYMFMVEIWVYCGHP